MSSPKVLIWDVESSGLVADFATILCIGWKWLGEKKTHVISITDYPIFEKDPTNDKQLIKDFLKIYSQAQLTVAFNGVLFDRPMLLAKVMEHKLQVPPNIPLQDPYFCVKSNLRISRKSLQNVGYFLELSNEKTPVEGRIWKRAQAGHRPSIDYIKRHCVADVKVLEEAYVALRPLMRTHFRLSDDLGACRYCNERRLQRRGKQVSKLKGAQVRVQCQACAGWDTRTLKEVEKYEIRAEG